MPDITKPLANAGTVAMLLAHAEQLAAAGVFTGKPYAQILFEYCAKHPAKLINYKQMSEVDSSLVDGHADILGTGMAPATAYKWLIWLREENLIAGGPGSTDPLLMLSVNARTESERTRHSTSWKRVTTPPDTDTHSTSWKDSPPRGMPRRRASKPKTPEPLASKGITDGLPSCDTLKGPPARYTGNAGNAPGLDVDAAMMQLYPTEHMRSEGPSVDGGHTPL